MNDITAKLVSEVFKPIPKEERELITKLQTEYMKKNKVKVYGTSTDRNDYKLEWRR